MLGILTVGCSPKTVPAISLPTEKTPCDEAIQKLLDSVSAVDPVVISETVYKDGSIDTICVIDSSNCNYYKLAALDIAGKYNTAIKERDFYKAIAQSQAKKITNNTYINSNNKKSQIGDGNISQDKIKAPAIVGDGNVTPVKPKQSAIGDGNKLDNSKKGIGWFWIFLGGYLFCHVIHKLIIPFAMRFIPFANVATNFKNIFKIFTS